MNQAFKSVRLPKGIYGKLESLGLVVSEPNMDEGALTQVGADFIAILIRIMMDTAVKGITSKAGKAGRGEVKKRDVDYTELSRKGVKARAKKAKNADTVKMSANARA